MKPIQTFIVEYKKYGVLSHDWGTKKRCNQGELEIWCTDNLWRDLVIVTLESTRPNSFGCSIHFLGPQPQYRNVGVISLDDSILSPIGEFDGFHLFWHFLMLLMRSQITLNAHRGPLPWVMILTGRRPVPSLTSPLHTHTQDLVPC